MKAGVKFAPAKRSYVDELRGRLRPADVLEILAASGRDPDEALRDSFERSSYRMAILLHHKPFALFGVGRASLLSTVGVPWLLGTVALDWMGIGAWMTARYYVNEMKRGFSTLENFVDARNVKTVRWLKWSGFTVEPAAPYGVAGLPFHHFWMKGGSNV